LGEKLGQFFPQEKKEINASQGFRVLWEEFKKESQHLLQNNPSFPVLISRILYLLEKYTLFIPSSAYKDKPEISLFHHLKSTCAIATVLYDAHIPLDEIDEVLQEIKEEDWKGEEVRKERFILLQGDISGIQDFIYSVTSGGALKGLRGRSFYLEILSEIVARRILDEFNLIPANLLYLGGGNFTILLPYTSEAEEKIQNLQKELDEKIYKAHQGKLGIILGYFPFSYLYFKREEFPKLVERMRRVLSEEKRRKFKNIMDEGFFQPYPEDIDKKQKACEICGMEMETQATKDKCSLCESFEGLSIQVRRAGGGGFIEIRKKKPQDISSGVDKWHRLIESIGYEVWLGQKNEGRKSSNSLVYSLNSVNFLSRGFEGFRFESVYSPLKDGTALTLEEISDKAKGIKKWGVLRMDVDNLGRIFSEGLKNLSISRFSMLSYMIHLFFSSGVREIVEGKYPYSCIVYSGGDDLFILGPWNDLPEIAREIYQNFRKFTGKHPAITLSGGIYIAPSRKFPVYQSAYQAGEMEEKAKKEGKDRLSFLNLTVDWKEFENLSQIKNYIVDMLEPQEGKEKKFPRSLLTLLYSALEEEEEFKNGKRSISRIWLFLYGLRRLVDRYISGGEEQLMKVEELRDKFVTDSQLRENLALPVRWADYLTRKEAGGI